MTVFEKLPVAGGMMAVGIPEFRLPRNILEAEIAVIRKLGVEIRFGVEVGKDIGFDALRKEYQAVFLGVGCHKPLKLGIPGEDDLSGVVDGLTFLREVNLGKRPEARGRLVVVGGGNTAVDCARTAKRLGHESVAILYRRTREEMPANPWEVEDTIEEEVEIQYLISPVRIVGENGRVSGVECARMKLGEPDSSGRRRPVRIDGSEFVVPAETVVTALGQVTDCGFLPPSWNRRSRTKGFSWRSRHGVTEVGLFSGGDAVTGPRTVVEAVAQGKEAARSIDRYLSGKRCKRSAVWRGKASSTPPKLLKPRSGSAWLASASRSERAPSKRSISDSMKNRPDARRNAASKSAACKERGDEQ